MIKQLIKHDLKYYPTWEYIKDNLDEANTLSCEILKLLDFTSGYFFTLLPLNANLKNIHNFKSGGILPQFPEEEHVVNGYKSTFSWIPNIHNQLSDLILKKINSDIELSCIFDDVVCSPEELEGYFLFDYCGLIFNNESYYLLKKGKISIDLIKECLKVSNAFWHSLCIFTSTNDIDKSLTLEKIREICLTTELVMVGAYDAEGYIFWQKKLGDGKGFFESI